MKILVLNAGSSSIKYSLFAMSDQRTLLTGIIERIGESLALHRYRVTGNEVQIDESPINNHKLALQEIFSVLKASGASNNAELACIGHRVVHGGE